MVWNIFDVFVYFRFPICSIDLQEIRRDFLHTTVNTRRNPVSNTVIIHYFETQSRLVSKGHFFSSSLNWVSPLPSSPCLSEHSSRVNLLTSTFLGKKAKPNKSEKKNAGNLLTDKYYGCTEHMSMFFMFSCLFDRDSSHLWPKHPGADLQSRTQEVYE